MERKWYQEPWAIIALLVFFFPVGLYLMWRHAAWDGRIKWAVTGILAVLIVVIAVSGAVGGDDDEDSELAAAGASTPAVATATPPAPPTQPPTQAPTEPATEVPSPTTELPEFTAAECLYMLTVQEQTGVFSEALTEVSELLSEPEFLSDEWIFGVAAQLAAIRVTYDDASALDPPTSLRQVHEAYIEGLSKLNDATFLIAEGIDNLDPEPLLEATDLMLEGTQDIGRTTALIEVFGTTRFGSC